MGNIVKFLEKNVRTLISRINKGWIDIYDIIELNNYLHSNRRPWRRGYGLYRNKCLEEVLNNPAVLDIFLRSQKLPENYGYRLDARLVEIPWVLSRLQKCSIKILDAGSSLNNEVVVTAPRLSDKNLTIITLAPEEICFWKNGISYIFGDIRNLDFKDETFNSIVCISTIEHVGMDNFMYDKKNPYAVPSSQKDFIVAIKELKRVLKTGGALYCTFPFGKYENHGWFQQFDSNLMDCLIEEFRPIQYLEKIFKYNPDGWILSDRESCKECQFFDVHVSKYFDPQSTIEYPPDYPAGERAVACLELIK
jgi:SAM-dependent methyltransferase